MIMAARAALAGEDDVAARPERTWKSVLR